MYKYIEAFFDLLGEGLRLFAGFFKKNIPILHGQFMRVRTSMYSMVVITIVILALIPVSIIAIGTYIRTRSFIIDQTQTQLDTIVSGQSKNFVTLAENNQKFLEGAIGNATVVQALEDSLLKPGDETIRYNTLYRLNQYVRSSQILAETGIDGLFLVSDKNIIIAASHLDWLGIDLSGMDFARSMAGTNKTIPVFNPSLMYPNELVTFTSMPFTDTYQSASATLYVATLPRNFRSTIETAASVFSRGQAYVVTASGDLIGIDSRTSEITQLPIGNTFINKIKEMFKSPSNGGSGQIPNPDQIPVIVSAKWLPTVNMGFVLTVPESVVLNQIDTQLPFTLLLVAISFIVIIATALVTTRAFVGPIVQLTTSARSFARGDWSARSHIRRRDEIGVLASTFNQMVEQISDLYRSLEQKVEERARQLRTASEIGQLATSASTREEIVERAVKLVIDRFGYSYASIYLLHPTGNWCILQAAYSQSGELPEQKGYRVAVGTEFLVGWAAKNNRPRVVTDLALNDFTPTDFILSSSKSEIAIPIAVGGQVLGVFEIQSINLNGFEIEQISVLQTLCSQIANGLQNLRLLESTQIDLEETSLLYRASRQISMTKSENEMLAAFRDALAQTPYVTGIFQIRDNYVNVAAMTDPRSPATVNSAVGLTLPMLTMANVLERNNMVLVEDLSKPNDFDNILSFFTRRGCHSAVLFSIQDHSKLVMVLVIGSRDPTPLALSTMQPFASLMEVVSTTLQRFNFLSGLEQQVYILQTLKQVSESISVETDLSSLYQTLHVQIRRLMGDDIVFLIAIYKPEKNQIEIPYVYEDDKLTSLPPISIDEGLSGYLFRSRQPLLLTKNTEKRAQELGARVVGKAAKSWMGIPLMYGNEMIASMIFQNSEQEDRFSEKDLNLFTAIAPQVATAVRNAQLVTEMREALKAYDQERFMLNTLMENIPDQIYFKDSKGAYIRVSRSYSNALAIENPLEVVGKSDDAFVDSAEAEQRRAEEEEIVASDTPILGQIVKAAKRDGSEEWFLNSQIPMVTDEGHRAGLLGISRDITDLKMAEYLAEDRAKHLRITAEIARDTSGTLETNQLLSKAVNMVRDRFGFYHASIFIMDTSGEYAILREATGEVGAQMKQRGHRLAVGSQSIVGQAVMRKEPFVVNDVTKEKLHYANPMLPDTRSELAIPLMIGERVLGVLDVQSRRQDAFSDDEVKTLHILADQLGTAVWNSILFGQIQENLTQHRLLHQITIAASSATTVDEALGTTVKALHTALGGERVITLLLADNVLTPRAFAGFEGQDLNSLTFKVGEGLAGMVAETRQPVRMNDLINHPELRLLHPEDRSELAVPIFYSSDRLVGVLAVGSSQAGAYDETDQEIMASLGNTLGAVIANTQLVREVRLQVERQRQLYDITNRIRRTGDIQTILQTSAREIARTVGARRAQIEIKIDQPVPAEMGSESNHADGNGHNNGKRGGK